MQPVYSLWCQFRAGVGWPRTPRVPPPHVLSQADARCGQEVSSGAFELRDLCPSLWSVSWLVRFWLGTGSGLTRIS